MRAWTAVLFVCLAVTGCALPEGGALPRGSDGHNGAALAQDGGGTALDAGSPACFGLSPQGCSAAPGCTWQWSPCVMMACAPDDGGCPVCDPAGSCVPSAPPPLSHCQGLNERTCNETSGCVGIYDASGNAFDHCTDDAFCGGGSTGGGTAVDGGAAPAGP